MRLLPILLVVLASCAPPREAPPSDSGRWRVSAHSVDPSDYPRVRLLLGIESADGKGAPQFAPEDCRVLEGGSPRRAEKFASLRTEPVTTVLVFDRSGSMEGEKLEKAKAAAIEYVRRMSPEDFLEVIAIDDVVDTVASFSDNRAYLGDAIARMEAGGRTHFYDGVRMAAEEASRVTGARAILAMTDGRDNESACTLDGAIRAARKSGVRVFTVGLGEDLRIEELTRLAAETGGTFHHAPRADDLAAIHSAISEQLHHEYVVEYVSDAVWDGRERRIQVELGTGHDLARVAFAFNPGGVIPVTPLPPGPAYAPARLHWFARRLSVFGALTLCLAAALVLPLAVGGARRRVHRAWFLRRHVLRLEPGSAFIGRLCSNEQNRDVAFHEGETVVRCPTCGALHHADCWTFNDGRCYNSPPCTGKGPRLA